MTIGQNTIVPDLDEAFGQDMEKEAPVNVMEAVMAMGGKFFGAGVCAVIASLGNDTAPAGYGLGVAIGACGDIVWANFATVPSLLDAHTFLSRIAP